MTKAHTYAQENKQTFYEQLMAWLRIPSISTDPAYKEDVQLAAQWLADEMQRIGLENISIMPTDGHPVVYGDWLHAGDDAPTILVYGHYDVQPAVMEDGWSHPPFEPQMRDGKIFARGATDDKGQVMAQMKALEALLATKSCEVNLKYLIEGEEEVGSPHLPAFVDEHADMLEADICLVSDTGIKAIDQPAIVYGLRGLLTMQLTVRGPKRDLHSGMGGMIHNPAQALAEILAQLHTPDGTVTVPHFYDDVRPLSTEERKQLVPSDVSEAEWQAIMGDLPDWGEQDYTRAERMGARPTLEINGIAGGYAGEGFKTVLPAEARAKISCRLVPDQDPEVIYQHLSNYITSIAPPTVQVELEFYDQGYPALTSLDDPAVKAAIKAYKRHWEKDPITIRGGGSIPIVAEIQELLEVPVVLLGFALPDAGAHGPDENFYLEMYDKGVATIITYMQEIAGMNWDA
jgi:acetylornithine deacetylase/succinyl-diaminopimelate desuccinylase-like protein